MTVVAIEQPEDGGSYVLTGQAARDYLDGLALRRLREALPEPVSGTHVYIDAKWVARPDTLAWLVIASVYAAGPRSEWRGRGATIASAADACREALSSPQSPPQDFGQQYADHRATEHPKRETE